MMTNKWPQKKEPELKSMRDLAPHRLQLKMWLSLFSGNDGVEGRVAWEDLTLRAPELNCYRNQCSHMRPQFHIGKNPHSLHKSIVPCPHNQAKL